MDTRFEPMTSLKGYLMIKSFGSVSVFRWVEFGSQRHSWAVQHFGDIR